MTEQFVIRHKGPLPPPQPPPCTVSPENGAWVATVPEYEAWKIKPLWHRLRVNPDGNRTVLGWLTRA